MYNIYGIRHHGPGSTRSLLRALEANPPDCLLIEAPADADKVLEYALHPGIIPPVAILLYDEKDLSKASYLPFASFSPEWQAIQYGLAQGIPIHFMDLPMGMQFQMEEENNGQLEIPLPSSENEGPIVRDPMGYIAELAGYSDSEFVDKGATIVDQRSDAFQANVVCSVRTLGTNPEAGKDDLQWMRSGHFVLGTCDPLGNPRAAQEIADTGVSLFGLELIPRITRAQSMDILSSMACVAGYRAVLLGAVERDVRRHGLPLSVCVSPRLAFPLPDAQSIGSFGTYRSACALVASARFLRPSAGDAASSSRRIVAPARRHAFPAGDRRGRARRPARGRRG